LLERYVSARDAFDELRMHAAIAGRQELERSWLPATSRPTMVINAESTVGIDLHVEVMKMP
jgi:hypothetical protein